MERVVEEQAVTAQPADEEDKTDTLAYDTFAHDAFAVDDEQPCVFGAIFFERRMISTRVSCGGSYLNVCYGSSVSLLVPQRFVMNQGFLCV